MEFIVSLLQQFYFIAVNVLSFGHDFLQTLDYALLRGRQCTCRRVFSGSSHLLHRFLISNICRLLRSFHRSFCSVQFVDFLFAHRSFFSS